jgi:CHAT domain-containing protein
MLPGGSGVVLVPDGALHRINFEMLPVGSPRHYWIDDATIAIAPSLSLLAASTPAAAPATPRSWLVIGNAAATPGAPALAFAREEIDNVARAAPPLPVVLQGADASPPAYLNGKPETFSVIHFAAHATVNGASPLDSAVELSPAGGSHTLYARDVAARPLNADLVTISACRSAGSRTYAGEGLVGFAWAFQRAGARRVIAGLWDVDDRSTATLMTTLYARLSRGETPAAALRAAKLDLIRAGGNFAKPYYWAPLQVFTITP